MVTIVTDVADEKLAASSNTTPNVRLSTAPAEGMMMEAKNVEAMGKAVGGAVVQASDVLYKRQLEMDGIEADQLLEKFKQEQNQEDKVVSEGVEGFGQGYADQRIDSFEQRRNAYLQQVPPSQREKWALKTEQVRTPYLNEVSNFEVKRRYDHSSKIANDTIADAQRIIIQDPSRTEEQLARIRGVTDQLPINQDAKDKLRQAGLDILYKRETVENIVRQNGDRGAHSIAQNSDIAGRVFNSLIQSESAGNSQTAPSSAGALGLTQLMPNTAREKAAQLGMTNVAGMSDAQLQAHFKANPDDNVRIGRAYFNDQIARYTNPNTGQTNWEAVLVAYNAGPANADKFVSAGNDFSVLPKRSETEPYVRRTLARAGGLEPNTGLTPTQAGAEGAAGGGTPGAPGAVRAPAGAPSQPRQSAPFHVINSLTGMAQPGAQKASNFAGLSAPFATGFYQMIQDAPPDIQREISISSANRTREEQQVLWDRELAKQGGNVAAARKNVAPPGGSNHEHGEAMDIKFASPRARQWMHENAGRYGMHFPLAHEPWHIEPIAGRRNGGGADQGAQTGGMGGFEQRGTVTMGADGKPVFTPSQGGGQGAPGATVPTPHGIDISPGGLASTPSGSQLTQVRPVPPPFRSIRPDESPEAYDASRNIYNADREKVIAERTQLTNASLTEATAVANANFKKAQDEFHNKLWSGQLTAGDIPAAIQNGLVRNQADLETAVRQADAYTSGIAAGIKQHAAQKEAERKAIVDSMGSRALLGKIDDNEIDAKIADGTLKPSEASAVRGYLSKFRKGEESSTAAFSRIFNGGEVVSRFEKNDRDVVDNAYNFGIGKMGQEPGVVAKNILARTGFLPETFQNQLRSGTLGGNPTQAKAALEYALQFYNANPDAFTNEKFAAEVSRYATMRKLGYSADQATQRTLEMRDPEKKAKVQARIENGDLKKEIERVDGLDAASIAESLGGEFDPWGRNPIIGNSSASEKSELTQIGPQMKADYKQIYRMELEATGDTETAAESTREKMRSIYGVTQFSEKSRGSVVRHPPEKVFGNMFGSQVSKEEAPVAVRQEILEQARQAVRKDPNLAGIEIRDMGKLIMRPRFIQPNLADPTKNQYDVFMLDNNGAPKLIIPRFTVNPVVPQKRIDQYKAQGARESSNWRYSTTLSMTN